MANPRSMIAAQLLGAGLAVFISPAAFWLYWSGFNVGDPKGEYPAPFSPVFRNIAVVAVQGSKDLPKNCMALFGGMFGEPFKLSATPPIGWKNYQHHIVGVERGAMLELL